MRRFRKFSLTAGALIATLAFWGLIRLIFPALDYYPPEQPEARFERSWFVTAGVRKATMASYAACALVFITVFFCRRACVPVRLFYRRSAVCNRCPAIDRPVATSVTASSLSLALCARCLVRFYVRHSAKWPVIRRSLGPAGVSRIWGIRAQLGVVSHY